MVSTTPRLWTDAATLRALDLIDNEGLSARKAAVILTKELRVPVSRCAVIGVVDRVRKDLAKSNEQKPATRMAAQAAVDRSAQRRRGVA